MYDTFWTPEKSKPRILIVENDPKSRVSYQGLLMCWNYEPVLAMGTGTALMADAKKLAREKSCALALIDLRLVDDYDEQDISGLNFADEIGAILRPVIISGHENPSVLRTLLRKNMDIAFIRKHENRDVMEEMLNAEAAKVTATKRKLIFENPEILEDIAKSPLGEQTRGFHDQIADVFARLFPNAKKLRLEKLDLRPAASNISTVPRPNSVVLKVYEDDYEPYVVKLARAEKIQKEVENYKKYIFRRLTDGFTARLERSAILWDIGGASYSYIGKFDVKTFSSYYEENSIANIEECLTSFFGGVWGKHYENAHDKLNVSLFSLYSGVWDSWYEKRVKGLSHADFTYSNADSLHPGLPHPIDWFEKKIAEPTNDLSIVQQTRIGITHGDLHGDNLLVDNKKNVWVIDFERCGEGHILQDFIELEADIFNRLEEHNDNFPAYIKMCITVLEQKNIQGFSALEITSEDARVEKALQTISILRALARKYTTITDARQYMLGLLFNMIFRAAIVRKISLEKSQRPLLLASLICHRLDHWNDSWNPDELNLT